MLHIALLGFGTVGSGTAEVLTSNKSMIESYIGDEINIKYILDLREFPDSPFADRIVHEFDVILNDPEVTLIAEMMGGAHPAYDFTKAALEAGKHVVTSNKEVVATFGIELLKTATENGVRYLFEASVGGGIPVIRPLMNDFNSNSILSIDGILNGTTNYMLTKMKDEGLAFDTVLRDAQKKGYAERNPDADIKGKDAARKIVILAALAYGKLISPEDIYTEGITEISDVATTLATQMGYSIKLIGHTERVADGRVLAMVSPRLIPPSNPLSHITDVFNGILVETDMLGTTMFYGRGAGKLPTAGAVVADILDIARHPGEVNTLSWQAATPADLAPLTDYVCPHFLILSDPDGKGDRDALRGIFGEIRQVIRFDGMVAFITAAMSETAITEKLAKTDRIVFSHIRVLD
ncbi:MAG: homoserine dehydrogenase [Clostridia bacterium]|jgi:homoserine dehydrogenase|nr:homoserine dehydrogenase [Clostridia bacterium]